MCGIVGMVGNVSAAPNLSELVGTLRHRGPDGQGSVQLDKRVLFGHTRLRIIDLSDAGHQPMSNEDASVWIVFNGEIYNFQELRPGLETKGHQFKSRTDTEVIVHAYEELKEDCFRYLNGMFALALYDRPNERLVLARDRLGIKPLYYAYHNGSLVFASEIKAILKSGVVPVDVDWQSANDYFSYLYVPNPKTIFKGIYQVPPGHYLIFDLKTKRLTIDNYWHPKLSPDFTDYTLMKEGLRSLLKDSVRRQLVSDVPLGVFLSGGIDSTVLTGLVAQATSDPVKTFTVLFEGEGIKPYDETEYARRVSERFGTEHNELLVRVSSVEDLFDMVDHFDQPFANPTFYLSYLISQQTRQHVTVALSGAGGDELFGGYPRYRALSYAALLRKIPKRLSRWSHRLLEFIPEDYDHPTLRRAKLLTRGLGCTFPEQYLRWTYYFSDEEKRRLLHSQSPYAATRIIEEYLRHAKEYINGDVHKQAFFLDLKMFLVDNILEYTDKTSMAVGLEVRVPYLDHRLIEFGFKIPFAYKVRNGITKYILKDAFADLIPPENLRAPKRGFCPPLAVWMDKYLDRYFDDFMAKAYTEQQGIFNWEFLQVLRRQHKARRRDNSMELFGIIMFDVWFRKYVLRTKEDL
jgi:asparagine synthase (glutamine-hydrolysing)